ncbi:putative aminomethyltransferase folate-binding domain [Candidatus Terasakiella magnetica]|uniref:Putative aminomethyltransferase folate-binding domain n=1 Tax=Candidatus Terasakiella magnetica TaxID=1867952 RepID=A0A1C3RI48_9PROT|nr:folate-binding protein YgfZ [Candidatus Terasakiella magnetica]SCA56892.1 putative aminomethyltransferase folate-binding domain [Candidatus Terasakiella magnetica]
MPLKYSVLPNRGVLKISGEDRVDFLQGLISNDVTKATDTTGIYAAFLTPQGKFLCDFFILASQNDECLLIDMAADALPAFKKKLTMYKLRADVKIEDISEGYDILAAFGDKIKLIPGIYQDPRLEEAGYRLFTAKGQPLADAEEVDFETYDLHRIKLGLGDGARDMIVEKSILLEYGFDELHGVDWDKGCYMGQELTARTKYRALIKKRLVPVEVAGELPESGTEITAGDKTVGEVRSGTDKMALALLKVDALDQELNANGAILRVCLPDWFSLQA